jgi:hypothetical protein
MTHPTQPQAGPTTTPSAAPLHPTQPEALGAEPPTTPLAARAPAAETVAGRTFGRYELLEEIAHGGMGVVYKAWDRQVERLVALKMIRSGLLAEADEVARFCREAQAVVRLSHPHIIQVYDVGQIDGCPYFTMQLAPGGSLDRHLPRLVPDARAAAALIEKVARAVEHAHRRGILHRDLKPANLLLGEGDEPLVGDFGLAKFFQADNDELTKSGVIPGTPAYMAPEQAAGRAEDVGPATDVWALGVILYELLTGQKWAAGRNREEILHRILTETPPRPSEVRPDLDPALELVVLHCLERDPARRYASAGALADDLGRWLRGDLSTLPDLRAPGRAGRRWWRRPRWAVALLLCAALALGASLLWLKPRPPAPDAPVTLIDGVGPVGELNWIVGGKDIVPGPAGEGLSIRSDHTAMAQLLDEPPWESYRLEAEVRHDTGREGGAVGIYFGRRPCSSPAGPGHLVCPVGFTDHGERHGYMYARMWYMPDKNPSHFAQAHPWLGDHLLGERPEDEPPDWRKLAVEVTPGEVRIFFGEKQVLTATVNQIGLQGQSAFDDVAGVDWTSVPRGGIGIYVNPDGGATFRNMVVRPLHP